jgi:hypothetical protein
MIFSENRFPLFRIMLYAPSDPVAASIARIGQRSWVSGTIMRMVKPSRV